MKGITSFILHICLIGNPRYRTIARLLCTSSISLILHISVQCFFYESDINLERFHYVNHIVILQGIRLIPQHFR